MNNLSSLTLPALCTITTPVMLDIWRKYNREGDDSDETWTIAYVTIYVKHEIYCTPCLQVVVTVLVLCWATRLGSFLFMRVLAAGKDSRFDEIKDKPCALDTPPPSFGLVPALLRQCKAKLCYGTFGCGSILLVWTVLSRDVDV